MKHSRVGLALSKTALSAAMVLALSRVVTAQPLPKPDTLHIDYFASLAYAGPRLRDCAPGLTLSPGTYDSHQYGLFLARWTGDRAVHHGATSGHFPPAEIRLPAFFGVERYYPEVHATAHFNFTHHIDESNYSARVDGHDPRLLSYDLMSSADADFIYGPEFWPERFVEALSISLPPDAATDSVALGEQKAIWQLQAAVPSGTGAASKPAPENVVTSRWMSQELSNYLKLEIRGTIAKRVFSTETAKVVARAALLGAAQDATLTLNQVSTKDVLNYLDGTPKFADTRRYFDLDAASNLKVLFSRKGSLIKKLALINPVSIQLSPIRMGYDEVVVFSGARDGLITVGTEKLPADLGDYFALLQRWLHDRCDGAPASTVSYSLDYRTYMPWPKEGGKNVRKATVQALLPDDGEDIATHQDRLGSELWDYNDDILLTAVGKLDSLKARYIKSLPKVLIAEIAGLVTASSTRNLTAAEISVLRQRSKKMLELYCGAYKAQKQSPNACNDTSLDATP